MRQAVGLQGDLLRWRGAGRQLEATSTACLMASQRRPTATSLPVQPFLLHGQQLPLSTLLD